SLEHERTEGELARVRRNRVRLGMRFSAARSGFEMIVGEQGRGDRDKSKTDGGCCLHGRAESSAECEQNEAANHTRPPFPAYRRRKGVLGHSCDANRHSAFAAQRRML